MTEQEIEKLREKLGSDYSVKRLNGAITVELVDIWEGVEFASHIFDDEVYRVSEIVGDKIWNTKGTWFSKKVAKPSTESAYVDQLKAKAHELYGEIKDGDRFDRSEMEFEYNHRISEVHLSVQGWDYYKSDDKLYFGTICIYEQGKWAKRVDEPIRVNVYSLHYSREPIEYIGELIPSDTIDCTVHFTIGGSQPRIILKDDFRNILTKCLEDYLNKIQ